MKIKLHSVTDLITNSSTTIYTFSDNSEKAFKALVSEFFKSMGVEKTCDECFNVFVGASDFDRISDRLSDWKYNHDDDEEKPSEVFNKDGEFSSTKFNDLLDKVLEGKLPMPEWLQDEIDATKDSEYGPGTTLYITAKDPKFEKLAELFGEFLYSTEAVEGCE